MKMKTKVGVMLLRDASDCHTPNPGKRDGQMVSHTLQREPRPPML